MAGIAGRSNRAGPARWLALAALFLAGFSGLVYEVVWTRLLTLTLGATVIAGAAVLCAFMGGLALGSWLSGRWADTRRSRALSLMVVELAMAAVAIGLLPIFPLLTRGYLWAGHALHPSYYSLSLVRFAASAVVLLIPAALIAAAFPLVTKLAVLSRRRIGEGVALVYGVDTMGAVLGVIFAGFVLLPALGATRAVEIAAGLNVVAALLALASRFGEAVTQTDSPSEEAPEYQPLRAGATRVLLWAFAASGAAALSYEVLTIKALAHLLTMSFHAFCTMLTCFLLGLGAGSLACTALLRRRRPVLLWFALAEAGIGLLGLSLPLQFQLAPRLLAFLQTHGYPQWSGNISASAMALVPLTLLMGATLPLLVAALTPGLRNLGRSAGALYSINTLGGVGGALATTFAVLPFLGFKTGIAVVAGINLLVALAALWYGREVPARSRFAIALAMAALAAVLLPLSARSSLRSALLWRALRGRAAPGVLFYKEGEYGTVAVTLAQDPRVGFTHQMFVSATGEGGSDLPSLRAFQLLGNLPFLLHEDHSRPKEVLVCAFGMGITLGTAADQDSRSIDCVELVPEVLEAGRFFSPYNHDPVTNPKVQVHIEDARNFLVAAPRKYDIVIMDATHPKSGDSWMLYTRECYQLAKRALVPDGVCAQWVPRHSLSVSNFWSIVRTFQSVFRHTTLWAPPGSTHSVLVGTPGPTRADFTYVKARLGDPAVRRNLEAAEIPDAYTFLSYFVAGDGALAGRAALFPLNTDDLCTVQVSRGPSATMGLETEFADLMASPVSMVNLGADRATRAAAAQGMTRAFQATRLLRQGLAMAAGSPLEQGYAADVFREAHRLNPKDRDLAILTGAARPRLRRSDGLPPSSSRPAT